MLARSKSSENDMDCLPLSTQPKAPSGPCAESSTTERSKFGSESGGAESSKPGANAEVIPRKANVPAGARRSRRMAGLLRLLEPGSAHAGREPSPRAAGTRGIHVEDAGQSWRSPRPKGENCPRVRAGAGTANAACRGRFLADRVV